MDGLTPVSYPHERCDATAEQLHTLKDRFEDEDDRFGEHTDSDWPPRDDSGVVYPIFFTPDELDGSGRLLTDRSNQYNPFAGNLVPTNGEHGDYCNAPLNKWRDRYPEIRYCSRYTFTDQETGESYTYCAKHKGRHIMNPQTNQYPSAEEQMQTGMFTSTVDHVYASLGPWKRLLGWGGFESLMGDSAKEFAPEPELREFDFSEADVRPDGVDEEGILRVNCHYPTENTDPALSLYVAAMMTVQMITVQPTIMATATDESGEEVSRMMESKTIEAAQLTAPPSEHDSSPQEFKTLETWSEHHLNLPFSRLIRDRPKLLEYGGVTVDPEDDGDEVSADDIVMQIQADADGVETTDGTTDPNVYSEDGTKAESEKIVESAGDSTSSSSTGVDSEILEAGDDESG